MTYAIGNPAPGLGKAHKSGSGKPVNGILTLPHVIIGSPMVKIQNQTISLS
jgi:hypothetical protein